MSENYGAGHYSTEGSGAPGLDQMTLHDGVLVPRDTLCCSRRCADCHPGITPSPGGNYCCGAAACGHPSCVHPSEPA